MASRKPGNRDFREVCRNVYTDRNEGGTRNRVMGESEANGTCENRREGGSRQKMTNHFGWQIMRPQYVLFRKKITPSFCVMCGICKSFWLAYKSFWLAFKSFWLAFKSFWLGKVFLQTGRKVFNFNGLRVFRGCLILC